MERDAAATERLRKLIAKITALTGDGSLGWEKQIGSAHRYARWNNNLLILGPSEPGAETSVPRYLFITPFDSPTCIEVNSSDEQLGDDVLALVKTVDDATRDQPPTDPFALTDTVLDNLVG